MTKLYEAKNHILIHTGYDDPEVHRHMAAHIIFGLEDIVTVNSDGDIYQGKGVMIPAGISHAVDTNGKPVLVFLYDSTTEVAKRISQLQLLDRTDCEAIIAQYWTFVNENDTDGYKYFETAMLERLGLTETVVNIEQDERIAEATTYIRDMSAETISCAAVANAVCLSESRFSHLFKYQTGMTFSAYVIYQRLMYVYSQIVLGKPITEAAVMAGFSSSAHFADVNRRVFGLPASRITKNLSYIKIK